jgi:hypothetical protein
MPAINLKNPYIYAGILPLQPRQGAAAPHSAAITAAGLPASTPPLLPPAQAQQACMGLRADLACDAHARPTAACLRANAPDASQGIMTSVRRCSPSKAPLAFRLPRITGPRMQSFSHLQPMGLTCTARHGQLPKQACSAGMAAGGALLIKGEMRARTPALLHLQPKWRSHGHRYGVHACPAQQRNGWCTCSACEMLRVRPASLRCHQTQVNVTCSDEWTGWASLLGTLC